MVQHNLNIPKISTLLAPREVEHLDGRACTMEDSLNPFWPHHHVQRIQMELRH